VPLASAAVAVLAFLLAFTAAGCGSSSTNPTSASPATTTDSQERHIPGPTEVGSVPISPAVIATFIAHGEPSTITPTPGQPPPVPPLKLTGPMTLDLLVLWRGAPGWFLKDGHQSSSGGGDDRGHVNVRLEQAGVVLEINLDTQNGTARIAGEELVLGDANVILVDGVDLPEGPKVVGTQYVDPLTEPLPDGLYIILRRAPDLLPFMQCGAVLPDTAGFVQQVFDASCARMVNK
jgi:hypothetical protein